VAAARLVREPVFEVAFTEELTARLYEGETLAGKVHGKALATGEMLDLAEGGHVTFPHREEFDLAQPLTVECWVRFMEEGKSPVIVSCGEWRKTGWFLQRLGGKWRWHLGGLDCDGGVTTLDEWTHLVAMFDGQTARLYENGVSVADKGGDVDTALWPGELHIGQYSAGPGENFQVKGQIAGLKIYHRLLSEAEIGDHAQAKPALPPAPGSGSDQEEGAK
jgi:hypothetical protein